MSLALGIECVWENPECVPWGSGVCGSALEFMNDESSPSCIETPAIPFSQKFTVSMWVKLRKSLDAQ